MLDETLPPRVPGITGCILAQNDEALIEGALKSLSQCVSRIVVIDRGSRDRTLEIARRYTEHIRTALTPQEFESLAKDPLLAGSEWVLFLGSDERAAPRLGPVLDTLTTERGADFESLWLPTRQVAWGQWLRSARFWPGYLRAHLIKQGHFRLDWAQGAVCAAGRQLMLPADDPELAVVRLGCGSVDHWLQSLDERSSREAETLASALASHSWEAMIADFVQEWARCVDRGGAGTDGQAGFLFAFLSACERFTVRAKVWDLRRRKGELTGVDNVPPDFESLLCFMAKVASDGGERWLSERFEPQGPGFERIPAAWYQGRNGAPAEAGTNGHRLDISACVLARDGGEKLEAVLRALQGWADPILVVDASAGAGVGSIADRFGGSVLLPPPGMSFKEGLAALEPQIQELGYASARWMARFDSSEKVSESLKARLTALIAEQGGQLDLISGPVKPVFCGKWLQHSAGLTDRSLPLLAKRDALRNGSRNGAEFAGRVLRLPADDPDLALVHEPSPDLTAHLDWINGATGSEAQHLCAADTEHALDWRTFVTEFSAKWRERYDHGGAADGVPGFLFSFFDGFSRFVLRVKLWERVRGKGVPPPEEAMPASLLKIIEVMAKARKPQPGRDPQPGTPPAGRKIAPEPAPHRPAANPDLLDPVPAVDFVESLGRALRLECRIAERGPCDFSRELKRRLAAAPDVTTETGPEAPDVLIECGLPSGEGGADGAKRIAIVGWEPGRSKEEWLAASKRVEEFWVRSRFLRDTLVRRGLPAEKVRVIPIGIDTAGFDAEGPVFPLATDKTVRFLYFGRLDKESGADLALHAHLQAFGPQHDVCLVVASTGSDTLPSGIARTEIFRQVQDDPAQPQVLMLDEEQVRGLSPEERAELYRSCACLVSPVREEVDGTHILEAMACGLPVIATAGGPTDDIVDDVSALRVPSVRLDAAGEPWPLEPEGEALAQAFRWVVDHPDKIRERGAAARERILAGWTDERSTATARQRLAALTVPAPVPSPGEGKLWVPKGKKVPATPRKSNKVIEVTLCVIARDEAPRIRQCLLSAKDYVEQMVVVDTGSTDRTREIAHSCGAEVHDYRWTDSFSDARNFSIDQARGRRVLWMDADDTMSPENGRGLRELIRLNPEADKAYQIQVRIPPGPGEYSESAVDHVKLFPNRPDLRFQFRIHEQILLSLRKAGIPVQYTDLFVTHTNYDRSHEGQQKKRVRDFRLLDMDLRENPDHAFILFSFGMTYLYATREYDVADQYLRRCLARSDPRDSIIRKAYALLTTACKGREDFRAAIAASEEGRRHYPDDAELLYLGAQLYRRVNRLGDARHALERLLHGQDEQHYRSVDTGLRTYRGRHELALLLRQGGAATEADKVLRGIVEEFPEYVPARLELERQ